MAANGDLPMGEINGGMEHGLAISPASTDEKRKMGKGNEPSRLRTVRTRYASGFTMHALNHIQDGTVPERIVWVVKLLGLLAVAVWICWGIFTSYFNYEVNTTFKVSMKASIKYPKVYLCTHSSSAVHDKIHTWQDCSNPSSKSFNQNLCNALNRSSPPFSPPMGIGKYSDKCTDSNPHSMCIKGSILGQCVTFNADDNTEQVDDPENKTPFMFDIMRVGQAHYPLTLWISSGEWQWGQGVYQSRIDYAGRYTYKISKRTYKRLPDPYSDCVMDGSERDLSHSMFSGPYTQAKCAATCRIRINLELCGIMRNKHKLFMRNENYKDQIHTNLTNLDQVMCFITKQGKIKERANDCLTKCPPPCEEVKYEVSETYSEGDKVTGGAALPGIMAGLRGFSTKERGEVHWELQYKDLLETEIGQEESYTVTALIANFGGTLGLMCGMSAVSILELLIWCILSIAVFIFRGFRRGHDVGSAEESNQKS